jgi:hypothetical protein
MTVFGDVNSIAMSFVGFPLTYIFLALLVFPQAITMHGAILKVPNKILIAVLEQPMPMRLIIGEIPKILGVIGIQDEPLPILMIQTKPSLINSGLTNHNAHPMFKSMPNPPKIHKFLTTHFPIIILPYQIILGKIVLFKFIGIKLELS